MSKTKGFSSILILFTVTLLVGITAFLVVAKKQAPPKTKTTLKQEMIVANTSASQPSQASASENEWYNRANEWYNRAVEQDKDENGWRVYKDAQCGSTFHVPSVSEPLSERTTIWDFPRGVYGSVFMAVLGINTKNYAQTMASYSGFSTIHSDISVYVSCSKEKIATDKLDSYIKTKAEAYKPENPGMGPNSLSNVQTKIINKWGMDVFEVVWDANYAGTTQYDGYSKKTLFYSFMKNGRIYEVGIRSPTKDQNLISTANSILDKIEF